MYAKTLTYEDFDGAERTETFYFNLTKAECVKITLTEEGGIDKLLEKIISEKDLGKLMGFMEQMIQASYGEKDINGRGFHKSPEILENFMSTNAYSDLYMLLASDEKEAAAFANGIMPKSFQNQGSGLNVAPNSTGM